MEKSKYEEEYFVRMQGKKRQRTEGMTETIDDLLDFGSGRTIKDKKRKGRVRGTRRINFITNHFRYQRLAKRLSRSLRVEVSSSIKLNWKDQFLYFIARKGKR